MLDQMQSGAVLFSSLIYGHNGPAKGRQLAQFLLDILEPFMPLPVRNLVHGSIAFLTPILLVQLVDFSDFCPQTHDLFLENPEMIHVVRIYQFAGLRETRKEPRRRCSRQGLFRIWRPGDGRA